MLVHLAPVLLALTLAMPARANELESLQKETLRESNLLQAAEVADRIYRTVGDKDVAIIGIGRSPTIFVEMLREKYDYETDYLPLSGIKDLPYEAMYNGLSSEEEHNLDQYFSERLAPWLKHKKRLVFLDFSWSGISIRFMARELSRFVAKHQYPVQIVMGSIESSDSIPRMDFKSPHFHILSKDYVKTSFRITGKNETSNLMASFSTGLLDWFAPHSALDIAGILKNGAPPPSYYLATDPQLFVDLQRAVWNHVRKDPFVKPWLKKARIYRPHGQNMMQMIQRKCLNIMNRFR